MSPRRNGGIGTKSEGQTTAMVGPQRCLAGKLQRAAGNAGVASRRFFGYARADLDRAMPPRGCSERRQ